MQTTTIKPTVFNYKSSRSLVNSWITWNI